MLRYFCCLHKAQKEAWITVIHLGVRYIHTTYYLFPAFLLHSLLRWSLQLVRPAHTIISPRLLTFCPFLFQEGCSESLGEPSLRLWLRVSRRCSSQPGELLVAWWRSLRCQLDSAPCPGAAASAALLPAAPSGPPEQTSPAGLPAAAGASWPGCKSPAELHSTLLCHCKSTSSSGKARDCSTGTDISYLGPGLFPRILG